MLAIFSNMAFAADCDKACTFDFKPVCAKNEFGFTQEFSNKCVFDFANCLSSNSKIFIL